MQNTTTKVFLDSGDPYETASTLEAGIKLDGQTTNPSLIVKNPEIIEFLKTQKFTKLELFEKYHAIVMEIKKLLPNGDISAEVYANKSSTATDLVSQGKIIANWFPGIFVKLPITQAGLAAAEILTNEGISVNMTLCFSQEQAAAVHSATKNKSTDAKVYVSPFIGRLDDIGILGSDIITNIARMYQTWNSHVGILGASIRGMDHINHCFQEKTAAITAPLKLITEIGLQDTTHHDATSQNILKNIAYVDILEKPWEQYDISHVLTDKGLQKFADDWDNICIT